MSPTHGGAAPAQHDSPHAELGLFLAYTASMRMTFDLALIIGMALCYVVGQFVAADALSGIALALLLVFVIRLCGGAITWVATGR